MRLIDADALKPDADYDDGEFWAYSKRQIEAAPTIEERKKGKWLTCNEPPCDDRNVFIAHGTNNFMSCCIGHYDHDNGQWYEDRNWFAKLLFDGLYWCEMPILPIVEEKEYESM